MTGSPSPSVIDALNDILTAELTAVNSYFLHAKMCNNWGIARLHEHIDKGVGETVPEQLELDGKMEYDAVERFRKAINLSRDEGDETTAEMLEHMLESEEKHVDWLETQLSLLTQLGAPNYLPQQIRE